MPIGETAIGEVAIGETPTVVSGSGYLIVLLVLDSRVSVVEKPEAERIIYVTRRP